jgi:hypothetical protein
MTPAKSRAPHSGGSWQDAPPWHPGRDPSAKHNLTPVKTNTTAKDSLTKYRKPSG